jgi:hypothetical protein
VIYVCELLLSVQVGSKRGEDTKRNLKHAKRQSSSETTDVVQATIGHLR